MKIRATLLSGAVLFLAPASFAAAEIRCGWLESHMPGYWWLVDKDDSWTIMKQGEYEADGMDKIGDVSAGEYVTTNRNFGYTCACMDAIADVESSRIAMIRSFKQYPISKCINDTSLPPPVR